MTRSTVPLPSNQPSLIARRAAAVLAGAPSAPDDVASYRIRNHGRAPAKAPVPAYITQAEARGDSRPVSREEFDALSQAGKGMIDQMRRDRAPTTGLDQHWAQLKRDLYPEVRRSWGGATIDSHTGVPLPQGANKYALSVKPPGAHPVSIHEHAPRREFETAMDQARQRFGSLLENGKHHLGVFHDDENHRIDMDPVVVVDHRHEVEAIGAHTHAIGGAYNFADGNGYWPPHVADAPNQREAAMGETPTTWNGPGHWRSHADEVQPGYVHPDDAQPDLEPERTAARKPAETDEDDTFGDTLGM